MTGSFHRILDSVEVGWVSLITYEDVGVLINSCPVSAHARYGKPFELYIFVEGLFYEEGQYPSETKLKALVFEPTGVNGGQFRRLGNPSTKDDDTVCAFLGTPQSANVR